MGDGDVLLVGYLVSVEKKIIIKSQIFFFKTSKKYVVNMIPVFGRPLSDSHVQWGSEILPFKIRTF